MSGAEIYWDKIRAEMNREDWVDDTMNPGLQMRSLLLGTVMGLTPSGKFYMPWTSNQTEDDVDADAEWWERQQAAAEAVGLSIESGENDPCDIFAMEYRDAADADRKPCPECAGPDPEIEYLGDQPIGVCGECDGTGYVEDDDE